MAGPRQPHSATLQLLSLISQAGDVREIRIPRHNQYGHTAAGWFDSPEGLAGAAASWDGKANIYFSLNPVNPALLARANNRLNPHRLQTSSDIDVIRRRILFLDIDPDRPSGISSTDAELLAARNVCDAALAYLTDLGWPAPCVAMSGNGYYLLYGIDLPNDAASTELVKGVLQTLSTTFRSDAAHIDTTVFNPARIGCLIGTMKVKGDQTEDRRHRRSAIVSMPSVLVPVSESQLRALAGVAEDTSMSAAPVRPGQAQCLSEVLDACGIEHREHPADARGFTWYHVRQCPFHEDGRQFECGVGQNLITGEYAGHCFHPEGVDKGWQEFKKALLLDPRINANPPGKFEPGPPPARPPASRAVDGATFLLDSAPEPESIWGQDEQVLWARGESLMLAGPQGVGKTTLAQQLIRALLGLDDSLLGFPVRPVGRVMYISADRPSQARRSFARMVRAEDRAVLAERLVVWPGPLPFDIGQSPELLAPFLVEHEVGAVFIDSLKDVAVDLSKDETGSRVNHALQLTIAAGVEVAVNHHQRKPTAGNSKPKTLSDVYGSTWITAGAGSVILLWGEPGDPVVEFSHLKQPLSEVGPFKVVHDQEAGRSSVLDQVDLLAVVRSGNGTTVEQAARLLYRKEQPSDAQVEKARRQLKRLVKKGLAHEQAGSRGGRAGEGATRWFAVDTVRTNHEANHPVSVAKSTTKGTEQSRVGPSQIQTTRHETNHGNHGAVNHVRPPLLEEGATGDEALSTAEEEASAGWEEEVAVT